jgi:hypothetical protein
MQLNELTIRRGRNYNDENPQLYYAEIEYKDRTGNVKMALDADISAALLAVIGPAITKFASKAALEIEQSLTLAYQETKQLPVIEQESV